MDYRSFGRFTDPKEKITLLKHLPNDVGSITKLVENQIVHQNLLSYYGVGAEQKKSMKRLSTPQVADMLEDLRKTEPFDLQKPRKITNRLIGSCIYESHFLSSLLKSKGYQSRQRTGFFKNIREHKDHIVRFWHDNIRLRENPDFDKNPDQWFQALDEYSQHLNQIDSRIEHWIVEYFDDRVNTWQLLDGNTSFLKAHSNIDVEYNLSSHYYEFSFESWKRMRNDPTFDPDQYVEEPQDGRSHIRTFLLLDFFSLLNHEVAGKYTTHSEDAEFIKGKKYDELNSNELEELDQLANLLSTQPDPKTLIEFYKNSETLKLHEGKDDRYSFLFEK